MRFFHIIVNGVWSEWSEWTGCSVSCGSGNKYKNRTCIKSFPQYPGKYCHGNDTNVESCDNISCPGKYVCLYCMYRKSLYTYYHIAIVSMIAYFSLEINCSLRDVKK